METTIIMSDIERNTKRLEQLHKSFDDFFIKWENLTLELNTRYTEVVGHFYDEDSYSYKELLLCTGCDDLVFVHEVCGVSGYETFDSKEKFYDFVSLETAMKISEKLQTACDNIAKKIRIENESIDKAIDVIDNIEI